MYFGRNDYDPTVLAESKSRLQTFQGATSISSNQYFGRDEEEEFERASVDGGLLGDGNLANLENIARDAISKVMANPELQNVGESIRTGALKVRMLNVVLLYANVIYSYLTTWHRCLSTDKLTYLGDIQYHVHTS